MTVSAAGFSQFSAALATPPTATSEYSDSAFFGVPATGKHRLLVPMRRPSLFQHQQLPTTLLHPVSGVVFMQPVTNMATRKRSEAPMVKATAGLVQTYIRINNGYYQTQSQHSQQQTKRRNLAYAAESSSADEGMESPPKRSRAFNDGYDDSDHNYIIRLGELWLNRYRIHRILGKGSFGQVVEAKDLLTREHIAIKIIKNRKAFYHQALIEIRILEFLNAQDSDDSKNISTHVSPFENMFDPYSTFEDAFHVPKSFVFGVSTPRIQFVRTSSQSQFCRSIGAFSQEIREANFDNTQLPRTRRYSSHSLRSEARECCLMRPAFFTDKSD